MRDRLLRIALVVAALAAFALPAHASKDYVQFGSTIRIEPGQAAHDTVCFFCSVDDRGTVEGDIVVFFGNVRVSGRANHDIVNFFGNTRVEDESVVGHDLVNMFGGVRLGQNVSVGKDIVAMFGSFRSAEGVQNHGDRVIQPAWIFWGPLLLILTVIILVVRELRASRRRATYTTYPYPPQS